MFDREITSFGKSNLGKLKTFKNVRNIKQLRKLYPNRSDDSIWIQVASEYNDIVDRQNEIKRQQRNERNRLSKLDSESSVRKTMLALPSALSTKKSREERLQGKISSKVKSIRTTGTKSKQRYNRKALGDVFEDDEYTGLEYLTDYLKDPEALQDKDHVAELNDNLYSIIYNSVIDKMSRSDKRYNLNVNVFTQFTMENSSGDKIQFGKNSKFVERVISPNQISEWVRSEIQELWNYIEQNSSSDLTLYEFNSINVQFSMTKKVRGGSYIELPDKIKLKRCCVNIKNTDNKCIVWSIASALHYDEITHKDKNQVYCYRHYEDEIKLPDGIVFPINVDKDIPKIEKLNNLKINIFVLDENNEARVKYNTCERDRNKKVIDLLLLEKDSKCHFVWVRDLAKLVLHTANRAKSYFCNHCLKASFDTAEKLERHYEICFKHEAVQCVLPEPGKNILKFQNYGNMFPHPFSIFMDFESTLKQIQQTEENKKDVIKGSYQTHVCNSVGYKYNCIHDEYSEPLTLINDSNPDSLLEKLVNDLERMAIKSYKLTKQNQYYKGPIMKSIKKCEYCSIEFTNECKPCIHHDHIDGKYIATICSKCNLEHTYKRFLPVYIHNLKGYDSHFIVPMLSKYGFHGEISCIPNNEERYISFSKKIVVDTYMKKEKEHKVFYEIRFLDSLAFMASSLETLADNLKKGYNNIHELRETFRNVSNHFSNDAQFLLMIEKGVYPYEYIDSYEKLNEPSLPFIDKFYSKLNGTTISYKDYLKAQYVWKKFNCKTMLDYHNLYLSSDVLLLADVWENFKKVCMKIYKLDVSYYYTAPSLSWDAFLYHTQLEYQDKLKKDFEIELITDMDMYLFVENNIRGGLSQISKRYAKANNKAMQSYNKNAIDEYILYLDANNLYGYAMCQYLPQKDFKWNYDEWTEEKILALKDKPDNEKTTHEMTGYMFEVDLYYPDELHDLHNGYALAPENKIVTNDMLSDWQSKNRKETKIKKLVTSFHDKTKYGLNYRLLKLYLKLGLKITKIHRVLQFTQSNFMDSYIMKNTNERKSAKNDFEKDFYKLMNNSVYGKTMENVRNRINFSIVSTEEQALALRNIMKKRTMFNENCVGVHMLKREVRLCKPIIIGQCVLDQSKYLMNDFHYNFMLKKFERKNIDLLFTDTDSLCYHIRNQNPYEVIADNKDLFDLSNYPKDHPMYDSTNNKAIGKFKNEAVIDEVVDNKKITHVTEITEFVGLRSKLYSYTTEEELTQDVEEHHKCKGVKSSVVENELKTQMYRHTLFSRQNHKVSQNGFRSKHHTLYTINTPKVALSCEDDKVYITDNNIHTYTLGHFKIRRE
jgi:hypothetical protein